MASRTAMVGLAVGAVLAAGVLVLLTLTFAELRAMRSGLDRTEERITGMRGDLQPLAEEAAPLMRAGRPMLRRAGRDMEALLATVPRMERTVAAVGADVGPMLTEVRALYVLPAMASDIRGLREDMGALRTHMEALRGEMTAMRRHTGRLSGAMAGIGDDMEALPPSLGRVELGVGALAPQLAPLPEVRDALGTTVTLLQEMRTHLRSLDRKLGGTWR